MEDIHLLRMGADCKVWRIPYVARLTSGIVTAISSHEQYK